MKIAIMGAGGIGSFYGGMLARAGADVAFIARGEHLAAMRRDGLAVKRDDERFVVHPARATDDPAAVGPVGLVLLATKAYDLRTALVAMAPLVGPDTTVLPLLNGVDITDRLAEHLPRRQVLAGLTYIPANRPAPGVVNQPGPMRPVVFGEPEGPPSERCHAIRGLLEGAGIAARVSGEMAVEIWSKFMLVGSNAAVCGVTGGTIGAVIADRDTHALYVASCREIDAVARAEGVALAADLVERTLAHAAETPASMRPSLLQDLEQGRPLELDLLSGTVVRLGRKHGVPVPFHTFAYAALKLRAGGQGV